MGLTVEQKKMCTLTGSLPKPTFGQRVKALVTGNTASSEYPLASLKTSLKETSKGNLRAFFYTKPEEVYSTANTEMKLGMPYEEFKNLPPGDRFELMTRPLD